MKTPRATMAMLPCLPFACAVTLMLHGCSEYDVTRLAPTPTVRGDSAQVFLFSDPDATARVLAVEDELVEIMEVTTPQTVVLDAGDYVIHFSRDGYRDVLEGVLLGPNSFKEVSVRLDSVSDPVTSEPPSAVITVTPAEITMGESVDVTVESDGDVGILLPIGIFTTTGTYTDFPDRTGLVIYSYAAFRGGLWSTAADSVFVHPGSPPPNGDPVCTTVELFTSSAVTRAKPRVTLTTAPISIPAHVGPVTLKIRCAYSGDIEGQEDEVFAVGLGRGNTVVWALRQGSTCEAIPDSASSPTTIWVDAGEVNVPPGDYDVVVWHVATGEFPCYEPVGDLSGPNSVHFEAAKLTYCR